MIQLLISQSSWIRLTCNNCGNPHVMKAIKISQHPDNDSPILLCKDCVIVAYKVITEEKLT